MAKRPQRRQVVERGEVADDRPVLDAPAGPSRGSSPPARRCRWRRGSRRSGTRGPRSVANGSTRGSAGCCPDTRTSPAGSSPTGAGRARVRSAAGPRAGGRWRRPAAGPTRAVPRRRRRARGAAAAKRERQRQARRHLDVRPARQAAPRAFATPTAPARAARGRGRARPGTTARRRCGSPNRTRPGRTRDARRHRPIAAAARARRDLRPELASASTGAPSAWQKRSAASRSPGILQAADDDERRADGGEEGVDVGLAAGWQLARGLPRGPSSLRRRMALRGRGSGLAGARHQRRVPVGEQRLGEAHVDVRGPVERGPRSSARPDGRRRATSPRTRRTGSPARSPAARRSRGTRAAGRRSPRRAAPTSSAPPPSRAAVRRPPCRTSSRRPPASGRVARARGRRSPRCARRRTRARRPRRAAARRAPRRAARSARPDRRRTCGRRPRAAGRSPPRRAPGSWSHAPTAPSPPASCPALPATRPRSGSAARRRTRPRFRAGRRGTGGRGWPRRSVPRRRASAARTARRTGGARRAGRGRPATAAPTSPRGYTPSAGVGWRRRATVSKSTPGPASTRDVGHQVLERPERPHDRVRRRRAAPGAELRHEVVDDALVLVAILRRSTPAPSRTRWRAASRPPPWWTAAAFVDLEQHLGRRADEELGRPGPRRGRRAVEAVREQRPGQIAALGRADGRTGSRRRPDRRGADIDGHRHALAQGAVLETRGEAAEPVGEPPLVGRSPGRGGRAPRRDAGTAVARRRARARPPRSASNHDGSPGASEKTGAKKAGRPARGDGHGVERRGGARQGVGAGLEESERGSHRRSLDYSVPCYCLPGPI